MGRHQTALALPDTAPRGCTHLKLRQANRLVTRHYESFVASTGLKITQYSLLSHVVKLGPLRLGELAAAMQLGASTLTRNLAPLVQQGWVLLESDPADARGRVVVATPAGLALRVVAWPGIGDNFRLPMRNTPRLGIFMISVADVENLSHRLGAIAILFEQLRQGHRVGQGFAEICAQIVNAQRG